MDLRIIKTKKVIREAFWTLREKNPLEKIKVRELCKIALINKSTFYNHYEDIFALSEEIENELLDECFGACNFDDLLFVDPKQFFLMMPQVTQKQRELLGILFQGRREVLFIKMEKQLKQHYLSSIQSPEEDIILTFIIGGIMRTMQVMRDPNKYSQEFVIDTLSDIIRRIDPKRPRV